MLARFRGSMLGSLLGDCLGGPFEGEQSVGRVHLQNYFAQLTDPKKRLPFKPYTDDTAMTKSVALSLVECRDYNATDMAKWFTKEYFNEPKRGYGSAVHDVFVGLKNSKCEDPYRPAQRQFQGMGSYGNGAAMRVHPVSLMYRNNEQKAIEVATLQAKITHAHKLGYQGAVLQCLAVRLALHLDADSIDVLKFTDELIIKMKQIESQEVDNVAEEGGGEDHDAPWNTTSYAKRLETVKRFLSQPEPPPMEEIHGLLGVHVSALKSVPTAIYCFLASQKPLPGIECQNKLQRCLHFAIGLGGDTDTIAAMAGAISGAQLGEEGVPKELLRHCEASKEVVNWSDKLYEAAENVQTQSKTEQSRS